MYLQLHAWSTLGIRHQEMGYVWTPTNTEYMNTQTHNEHTYSQFHTKKGGGFVRLSPPRRAPRPPPRPPTNNAVPGVFSSTCVLALRFSSHLSSYAETIADGAIESSPTSK